MAVVNALLFVPRLLGVLVGTVLWIVAVPMIEFARGVADGLRGRSGKQLPRGRERETEPVETKAERGSAFDPTRVRPIWTASEFRRDTSAAKRATRPESDEERRAS